MELSEYTRQLLAGDMEQRSVGEDDVETLRREGEVEEILLSDFTAAIGP